MNMSAAAKSARLSASSNHPGAVPSTMNEAQRRELRDLKLIGANDGLTRRGGIARESAMTEALDGAFQ